MKTRRYLALALAVLMASSCSLIPGTPEHAFRDFQTIETKESYLVGPLCKAGEGVIPLVMVRVKNKELDRRRYAIGFLGTAMTHSPVTVLEPILRDVSESEYIRGDALEAIYLLNEKKGIDLAVEFQQRDDFLGRVSKQIATRQEHKMFRTKARHKICHPTD